jgi:dTDP-4-amino-4,6-dideoxygalactose transaminase
MKDKQFSIPFNRPFIVGSELDNIAQAVRVEAHLAGDGVYTKKCQRWLEEALGCKSALLTHSCTGALEMAAILCDLQNGDEVIMPSFTFVSTANAFVLRGATPVFVDIRPDTLNINEELIQQAITERTRAIVPVHYAGVGCAMDEILDIARQHNLFVIEDAAQSLLSTYKDQFLGTMGNLGCLSFHETKNIICGEGGALLINDELFIDRAEIIREKGTNRSDFLKGRTDKYTWVDIGSSFLPSELNAAFLFAQLEEAEKIVSARRRIFNLYHELLLPLERRGFVRLPGIKSDRSYNGHIFYLIARSNEERSRLIEYLKKNDILSVFHYVPLHSSPAGQRYGRTSGQMRVTDDLSQRLVRLPLFFELTEEQVAKIVKAVETFYIHSAD